MLILTVAEIVSHYGAQRGWCIVKISRLHSKFVGRRELCCLCGLCSSVRGVVSSPPPKCRGGAPLCLI